MANKRSEKKDDVKVALEEGVVEGSWVSPEVLAARAGETVEMGKDLSDNDADD